MVSHFSPALKCPLFPLVPGGLGLTVPHGLVLRLREEVREERHHVADGVEPGERAEDRRVRTHSSSRRFETIEQSFKHLEMLVSRFFAARLLRALRVFVDFS